MTFLAPARGLPSSLYRWISTLYDDFWPTTVLARPRFRFRRDCQCINWPLLFALAILLFVFGHTSPNNSVPSVLEPCKNTVRPTALGWTDNIAKPDRLTCAGTTNDHRPFHTIIKLPSQLPTRLWLSPQDSNNRTIVVRIRRNATSFLCF